MEPERPESENDRLIQEYGRVFKAWDDTTLARWMAQTLSQFEGSVWRLSHPLIRSYQLAAAHGNERGTWGTRLAKPPASYSTASCCGAPLLPLFTRDVKE